MFYVLVVLLLSLTGCRPPLSVYTESVDRHSLASSVALTPDPKLNNPSIGQKIVIQWSLPQDLIPATLFATIYYKNGQESIISKPVRSYYDTATIYHIDQEFYQKGVISTYKVEIFKEDRCIATFYHHLWTQKIELDYDNCQNTDQS